MGVCNPACQKVIFNSGLVAYAADLLASLTHGLISTTATQLATAARALKETYDDLTSHGLITLVSDSGRKSTAKTAAKPAWDGCDEAKTLWAWVAEARADADAFIAAKATEAIAQMREWMIALDAQGLELVAGS